MTFGIHIGRRDKTMFVGRSQKEEDKWGPWGKSHGKDKGHFFPLTLPSYLPPIKHSASLINIVSHRLKK